MSAPGTV